MIATQTRQPSHSTSCSTGIIRRVSGDAVRRTYVAVVLFLAGCVLVTNNEANAATTYTWATTTLALFGVLPATGVLPGLPMALETPQIFPR